MHAIKDQRLADVISAKLLCSTPASAAVGLPLDADGTDLRAIQSDADDDAGITLHVIGEVARRIDEAQISVCCRSKLVCAGMGECDNGLINRSASRGELFDKHCVGHRRRITGRAIFNVAKTKRAIHARALTDMIARAMLATGTIRRRAL